MADMQNQKTNPSQQSGAMDNKKPQTEQKDKDNKPSSTTDKKSTSGSSCC